MLLGGRQGQSLINGKSAAPASLAAQERAVRDALHAQPGTLHHVTEASGQISMLGQSGQLSWAGFGGYASWTGYAMIAGHWYDSPGQVDVNTAFLTATGATVGQQYTLASAASTSRCAVGTGHRGGRRARPGRLAARARTVAALRAE